MIVLKSPIVVIVLVMVVSAAGCTYPSASANTVEFSGTVERADGQFHMAGNVSIDGTNDRGVTDVSIVLYDANQTVIDQVPVGSLSRYSEGPHPTQQSVNITTDRLPTYVVIESPDLWTNGVPSEAFRWTGNGYAEYWVESTDERFPAA